MHTHRLAARSITWIASALASLWLGAAGARAHGGPPSALGIVAAGDNGQPNMVLLNEGLAVAREDRWSFLCPSLWGETDTSSGKVPLAASVDGTVTFIIGADDLYLARDGVVTAQGRADLSSAAIVALAGDDAALFGLSLSSSGSAVVRIDEPSQPPLFTSPAFWSALSIDAGRLHLARATDAGEFVRLTLDLQGQVQDEVRSPLQGAPAQLRLRPTPQRLFAVSFDGQQHTLAAIGEAWEVLLQSTGPIQGPQASAGGSSWVGLDGELMRVSGAGFAAVGETRRVTCLEQSGSLAYACVGSDIHRLGDDGLQERLFQLDRLSGPDPALVPATAARECEFQWLLYRNDLERTGLEPREWSPPATAEPEDAGGPASDADATTPPAPGAHCSAAGGSARVTPLGLLWAVGYGFWVSAGARARRKRRKVTVRFTSDGLWNRPQLAVCSSAIDDLDVPRKPPRRADTGHGARHGLPPAGRRPVGLDAQVAGIARIESVRVRFESARGHDRGRSAARARGPATR